MSLFKNPYCLYICILFTIVLLHLLCLFFNIVYGIIKEIKSYKKEITSYDVVSRRMKKLEKLITESKNK